MINLKTLRLPPVDWRWMIVTYCFLILFHLFPSFLISSGYVMSEDLYFHGYSSMWPIFLWLGIGVLIITAYVGYHSRGVTMMEPGVASSLYVFTMLVTTSTLGVLPVKLRFILIVTLWLVLVLLMAFVLGFGGAAFGKWLNTRKQKQLA
jgi:hypothetical protein